MVRNLQESIPGIHGKLEKCAINHHFEKNRPTFLFTDAGKNVHDSNNKIAEFALILSQKDLESEKL